MKKYNDSNSEEKDVEDTMLKLCETINNVEVSLQNKIDTVQQQRKQLQKQTINLFT